MPSYSVVQIPSLYLVFEVRRGKGLPFASGDFSDVVEGELSGDRVAIRRRRVSDKDDPETVVMELLREIEIWKMLEHKNILCFAGAVVLEPSLPPCTLSPLMENGTVREYLRANQGADRLRLVTELCQGLQYLHSQDIVHGELKGDHVLISDSGHVRLCGFRFAVVRNGLEPINVTTIRYPCSSWPWLGRELVFPETVAAPTRGPSKPSDAYSLGMTVLEVFSGKRPFDGIVETAAAFQVWGGKTPTRPDEALAVGLTDAIWALVEKCWVRERLDRPTVSELLECVRSL